MPNYTQEFKARARSLREDRRTYREICTLLGRNVPKGTLSFWFRHITLPPDYYKRLHWLGKECILQAQSTNKQILEKRLSSLREKNLSLIESIDLGVAKLLLATLYWCEGNKYPGSRNLKFGNSDPHMIKLFITLLRSCYTLEESKFRLTVQCRADQNTLALSQYWKEITDIPLTQHYQPRVDQRSIGKPTQKLRYKGVCVIDYFDANLQCELQFLGEYLGTDSAILQMKKQLK